MFFYLGKPKSLRDLDHEPANATSLRGLLKIAVIDDEKFGDSPEAIRAHGYSLQEIGDISSVNLVQPFHVVICDVKGVGKHFGSTKEGAYLLSQIRRTFPDKYLILNTRHSLDASYHEALRVADKSVRKETPADTWVSVLDEAAIVMLHADHRWLRMRRYLLETASVDLFTVLKLEQKYIRAVLARSPTQMNNLATASSDNALHAVISEFAKAVAVDLAKDAFVAALPS